eukprot:CAMPEP_0174304708 /NCGR_PEP_ID=MMETSP0809-20121228/60948_1 /TAXON_ID=73025 ORGANISM="Eutreptiella gymnastica-like, Strain CCMP1594" /NCGR_SAMPLE_ID=MMETSP0809 /ASSEMBLY_ACC=CAM_ASM_000658 /LENGTH=117 /DNA_ID=CAMNT_0015410989 /DNA_START=1649 /DNA_END=1999 /DNA_ORIENTATION=-
MPWSLHSISVVVVVVALKEPLPSPPGTPCEDWHRDWAGETLVPVATAANVTGSALAPLVTDVVRRRAGKAMEKAEDKKREKEKAQKASTSSSLLTSASISAQPRSIWHRLANALFLG